MLKQRVVTAVVLTTLLLTALLGLPPAGSSALLAGIVGYAAWEWSDLAGLISPVARVVFVAGVLSSLAAIAAIDAQADFGPGFARFLLAMACIGWVVALWWARNYPASASIWGGARMLQLMGVWVLVPTWLSVHLLIHQPQGVQLVLVVILIVATADIGAYFAGRRFGRHKLAAAVSPGKTWEGLLGGQLCILLLALVFGRYLELDFERWPGWLLLASVTGLASVMGDLLESMVKRQRGVKDSGWVLPGHGGLLDRIDGLTAALPVYALFYSLLSA
ncbi:MAG: phosphatidate cytidylyltransferase [Porticoccaceae bacterium]